MASLQTDDVLNANLVLVPVLATLIIVDVIRVKQTGSVLTFIACSTSFQERPDIVEFFSLQNLCSKGGEIESVWIINTDIASLELSRFPLNIIVEHFVCFLTGVSDQLQYWESIALVLNPRFNILCDLSFKLFIWVELSNEGSFEVAFASSHPETIFDQACKDHDFFHVLNKVLKTIRARVRFYFCASLNDLSKLGKGIGILDDKELLWEALVPGSIRELVVCLNLLGELVDCFLESIARISNHDG